MQEQQLIQFLMSAIKLSTFREQGNGLPQIFEKSIWTEEELFFLKTKLYKLLTA